MPRILVQRRANVLVPITPHATKEVSKIADGDHIVVTINRGRSSRQNSFYHAILDKVAEGCGIDSPDLLHNQIREALGYYDLMQTLSGNTVIVLRSTSFDDMLPEDFKVYFDKAIDLICRDLLPHMTREDLARELQIMLEIT